MNAARSFTIRMDTTLHHDDAQLNEAFRRVDAARVELHQAMCALDEIIAKFNAGIHCGENRDAASER